MVKAIIFDWGGVFTHQGRFEDVIDEFALKFKADAQATLKLMIELWRPARIGMKTVVKVAEKI